MVSRPYVTGKDLIDSGIKPNNDFGTILNYAHKLRLAGVPKDNALKQTLSYARKLRKNIKVSVLNWNQKPNPSWDVEEVNDWWTSRSI